MLVAIPWQLSKLAPGWLCLVVAAPFVASTPQSTFLGLRTNSNNQPTASLVWLWIIWGQMKTVCFRISDCCFLSLTLSCATRGALVVAGWRQVVGLVAGCVLAVLLRVQSGQVAPEQLLLLIRRIVFRIKLCLLLSNSRCLWLVLLPQTWQALTPLCSNTAAVVAVAVQFLPLC